MLLARYASRKDRSFNDPGKLDRRVTLLKPVKSRDSTGGIVMNWTLVSVVWAGFQATPGREIQQAAQKLGLDTCTFRIRYRSDVTAEWRVLFNTSFFEVISPPVELGRKFYQDLICQAISPGLVKMTIIDEAGEQVVDESGNTIAAS